jgi:hypothetical protein
MTPEELPLVGPAFRWGPPDPVFAWLMLLGPVVVLLLALAGRSPATTAVAAGYVVAVPLTVLKKSL